MTDVSDSIANYLANLHPDWHRDAACREHPDVDFFPGLNVSSAPAKAVCAGCLVRHECLEEAYATGERYGIRGGLTVRQRSLAILAADKAAGIIRPPRKPNVKVAECGTRSGAKRHRRLGATPCPSCLQAEAAHAAERRRLRRAAA